MAGDYAVFGELNEASTVNSADELLLQQNGETKRISEGNFVADAVEAGNLKPVTSNAVKAELNASYYNKQSVDTKLTNYEKLYTSLSQLGISGSTTTLVTVWDKMDNNSEAKLDKNVFTDTMPNTDSAFILIEKLTVARGRIIYYTKDNASTYFMYLNSSNVPSGTWQRLATESDLTNYLDETFDSSQIAGFTKENITKILKYNDFSVKLGIDVNCSVPYSTNGFYSNIFNSTLPANLRPKQDTYVSCMYLKNNVFFCGTIVIGANGIISLFTSETDTHNIVRLAFNVSYLK